MPGKPPARPSRVSPLNSVACQTQYIVAFAAFTKPGSRPRQQSLLNRRLLNRSLSDQQPPARIRVCGSNTAPLRGPNPTLGAAPHHFACPRAGCRAAAGKTGLWSNVARRLPGDELNLAGKLQDHHSVSPKISAALILSPWKLGWYPLKSYSHSVSWLSIRLHTKAADQDITALGPVCARLRLRIDCSCLYCIPSATLPADQI